MKNKNWRNKEFIDIEETHIRLKTDISNHNLTEFILHAREDLKNYIAINPYFKVSLDKIEENKQYSKDLKVPEIVKVMMKNSYCSDVGPMATVAGTISELSLNYLIKQNSKYSIVENGGDIALINDKKIICGIYSNNKTLNNQIGFKLKENKRPVGICTSSAKIGHSISFGQSESVTVISDSASLSDGLATRIANDVKGENSEDAILNGLETCEKYKEYFKGILIICEDSVGKIGKLPKIVHTEEIVLDRI